MDMTAHIPEAAFGCVKNTIRLRSGRYLDLAAPRPDQFEFTDIAGALAKICRFGGQVGAWYSVAEHCCHCADLARSDGLPAEVRRAALMHDAAEAFCGDVVKPLKVMLRDYGPVEDAVERAIGERFGIDFHDTRAAVREIDRAMLIAERHALFTRDGVEWTGERLVRKVFVRFRCWPPAEAEREFTERARALGID